MVDPLQVGLESSPPQAVVKDSAGQAGLEAPPSQKQHERERRVRAPAEILDEDLNDDDVNIHRHCCWTSFLSTRGASERFAQPPISPALGTTAQTVLDDEDARCQTRDPLDVQVLNDDDVDVDDRLDVASLGDGSDDDVIKSAGDEDYAGSPFARDVIIQPGNLPVDGVHEQLGDSRSLLFDDQVGSLIFTNQVRTVLYAS